jgi:transposase-like protein
MEAANRDQIIDELRQLCAQYQSEVPSRRRTWPKSIKERILQLLQSELACEEIGKRTGIPTATIYGWKAAVKSSAPAFLPVQVVKTATKQVAVAPPARARVRRSKRSRSAPTLIVVAPNGLRFEGLDVSQALAIARSFGIGS